MVLYYESMWSVFNPLGLHSFTVWKDLYTRPMLQIVLIFTFDSDSIGVHADHLTILLTIGPVKLKCDSILVLSLDLAVQHVSFPT